MSLLITGSIALDSVKTPLEEHHDLLGGSASYAGVAAGFFTDVNLVGIVGSDFPQPYLELYQKHRMNLDGLEIADGKTFRWSGEYEWDMNNRRTLSVALNVFEKFQPTLPRFLPAHAVRFPRQHRATTPASRAGADGTPPVRRGRHDGFVAGDRARTVDGVAEED